jgi:hypothetical protein
VTAKNDCSNIILAAMEVWLIMSVDFLGSSKRHYQDAELLTSNKRVPNAGHLFGFAAECGIKALLVSQGLKTDPKTGDIIESRPHKYRTHVDVLINNVQPFPSSRIYSKYLGMMPNLKAFSNWSTTHRYYKESSIPPSHSDWREAAREVLKMLDEGKLDGVIA